MKTIDDKVQYLLDHLSAYSFIIGELFQHYLNDPSVNRVDVFSRMRAESQKLKIQKPESMVHFHLKMLADLHEMVIPRMKENRAAEADGDAESEFMAKFQRKPAKRAAGKKR